MIEVDPAEKKVISEIRFENADMITSCAFGGPNLDELYVTSGRIGDKTLPEVCESLSHCQSKDLICLISLNCRPVPSSG